jgi:hypothetical protein
MLGRLRIVCTVYFSVAAGSQQGSFVRIARRDRNEAPETSFYTQIARFFSSEVSQH